MRWLIIVVGMAAVMAAVIVTADSSVAHADPAANARQHFQAGEAHYRAERYAQAIDEYRAAYAALPEPAFLFNIAQAYRLGGDTTQAIEHYRRYLRLVPAGRAADAAREHISAMGGTPEPAPVDTAPPHNEPPQHEPPVPIEATTAAEKPIDTSTPIAKPIENPAEEPVATFTPNESDHDPRRGSSLRLAGLGTIAGGTLLAATAVYFGVRARQLSDEVSDFDGPMWMTELDDRIRRGQAAERNAVIFGIVGGAAITAGTILYVVGRRQGRASSVAFVPTPQGAQLVAVGHF